MTSLLMPVLACVKPFVRVRQRVARSCMLWVRRRECGIALWVCLCVRACDTTGVHVPWLFVRDLSCYLFGRDIHVALGGSVPIGLVATAWGASCLQQWAPAEVSAGDVASM